PGTAEMGRRRYGRRSARGARMRGYGVAYAVASSFEGWHYSTRDSASAPPREETLTPSPESSAMTHELARVLRLRDVIVIVVGTVIGSGIFLVPGGVLRDSGGDVGLALLVWIVGGALSLLGALTYAELGAMNPRAGGLYVYLRDAAGVATPPRHGRRDGRGAVGLRGMALRHLLRRRDRGAATHFCPRHHRRHGGDRRDLPAGQPRLPRRAWPRGGCQVESRGGGRCHHTVWGHVGSARRDSD